jgi:hypothetical protein
MLTDYDKGQSLGTIRSWITTLEKELDILTTKWNSYEKKERMMGRVACNNWWLPNDINDISNRLDDLYTISES